MPRPKLPGDTDADVVVVGAGFTGLWTAYYLSLSDPSLRVVVGEREVAGFGASGRNGGWCVGELAGGVEAMARRWGVEPALELARAAHATVDEVGAVTQREVIDCHFAKGGTIYFASDGQQMQRLERRATGLRRLGFGDEDYRVLSPREASAIVNARGLHGALYTPHTAALHPARLARGLAEVIERRGVRLFEKTAATRIDKSLVETPWGRIRAPVVVRATEAYTCELPGHERAMVPAGNFMIVTEPLSDRVWDEIGLCRRETFEDGRHLIFYGQRTADGRIAFGGLSVPYRYGSRTSTGVDDPSPVHDRLRRTLVGLFPVLRNAEITHRWGGVLGIPRDWSPSLGYDKRTGLAWAGGYVGEGVAAANLAGRTLADLICGKESDLVSLPWVNHRSPDWEAEPWRWLGVKAASAVLGAADRLEAGGLNSRRLTEPLLRRLLS